MIDDGRDTASLAEAVAGCGIIGLLLTGGASLFVALLAFFNDYNYGETALALIAAALAFGLLANALFRE